MRRVTLNSNVKCLNVNIFNNLFLFRTKKGCPLCGMNVANIPRHLRSRVHKFGLTESLQALDKFSLRKKYHKDNKKVVTTKKLKCPFPGCGLFRTNIYEHLIGYHRMERCDPDYIPYLKSLKHAEVG